MAEVTGRHDKEEKGREGPDLPVTSVTKVRILSLKKQAKVSAISTKQILAANEQIFPHANFPM